jgi:hypothetical protein
VGRLEDIVERNRRPPWYMNKLIRAAIIGVLLIVCFVLLAVTKLGQPKVEPRAPATHVDGIYLRR